MAPCKGPASIVDVEGLSLCPYGEPAWFMILKLVISKLSRILKPPPPPPPPPHTHTHTHTPYRTIVRQQLQMAVWV